MKNVLLLLLCQLLQPIFVSAQSPAIVFETTMAPVVPRQPCYCYSGIVCPANTTGGVDIRIVNNGTYCSTGFVYCCLSGGGGGSNIGINAPTCGRVYVTPTAQPAGQAAFGEFPWQVALYDKANPNIYVGGGALITSLHVLTAFHKVTRFLNGGLVARLGEWDLQVTTEPNPFRDIDVINIYNTTFNENNLQNDIAVLRLKDPAPIGPPNNPHINTVCLPSGPPVSGTRCDVAGWGKNAFNGQYQSKLKKTDVPVVSSADCQTALRRTTLGANFVLDGSFMCAGGEAGKDACTGDGGSALVCPSNGVQKTAVGLVSWGIKCADGGVPGVYTNVYNFDSWIKSVAVV